MSSCDIQYFDVFFLYTCILNFNDVHWYEIGLSEAKCVLFFKCCISLCKNLCKSYSCMKICEKYVKIVYMIYSNYKILNIENRKWYRKNITCTI